MFHTIVSIKNDGHYFCRAGGNRPDGLNEPVTNSGPFLRLSKITGSEGDSERKVTFPVVWASDGRVAGQEWLNRCGSLVSRRGFRRYRGKLVRSVFGLSRAFGPGLRKQKFERTGR
ncbi:hypothetical protein AHV36_004950 [Salmonella enterica subsp. enterica]|nr:hypothetical protein [Salmonella enterica subsp. enterica serovar Thomasville]EEC0615853.1 hypothetical protein [Salmonella enterica subsp. enterica]